MTRNLYTVNDTTFDSVHAIYDINLEKSHLI